MIDVALGGGLIKQRVARKGQGRSGGFRTIVAYRSAKRAVFLHGFAKNTTDNTSDHALAALKKLSAVVLAMETEAVQNALEQGRWTEVMCDGEEVQE